MDQVEYWANQDCFRPHQDNETMQIYNFALQSIKTLTKISGFIYCNAKYQLLKLAFPNNILDHAV